MGPTNPNTGPFTPSQPSRKGKKAWRKNVDVSSVTTGLEALREEIRTTGGPLAEQPNASIFALDTLGSEEIKKTYKLTKPLKADQIIAACSAIPAVDRRTRKRKPSELGDGVYESSSKRRKEGWVSRKEVARLKSNLDNKTHLDADKLEGDVDFDLWAGPAPASEQGITSQQDEYIPKPLPKVAPPTLTLAPTPLTASGKPVAPIPHPNAGSSYNPLFSSWSLLLDQYGAQEISAEQARLEKARIDAERQARIAIIASKPDEGYETGGESAWEGFETENEEEAAALKKKRPVRKTPQQRRKVMKRKEAERQARHEAATGRKQKQSEQALQALIKANKASELTPATESSNDEEEVVDDTRLRRRRLGPVAIPEKHLEVVLPDELQDSLRRLKPEGNLMTDRFRNLLVNGKIEARKLLLQPKQKKRKVTEKWSYKDFDRSFGVAG